MRKANLVLFFCFIFISCCTLLIANEPTTINTGEKVSLEDIEDTFPFKNPEENYRYDDKGELPYFVLDSFRPENLTVSEADTKQIFIAHYLAKPPMPEEMLFLLRENQPAHFEVLKSMGAFVVENGEAIRNTINSYHRKREHGEPVRGDWFWSEPGAIIEFDGNKFLKIMMRGGQGTYQHIFLGYSKNSDLYEIKMIDDEQKCERTLQQQNSDFYKKYLSEKDLKVNKMVQIPSNTKIPVTGRGRISNRISVNGEKTTIEIDAIYRFSNAKEKINDYPQRLPTLKLDKCEIID